MVYNIAIWAITGVTLAGLGIIILSSYVGTPSELALKAENEDLYRQLHKTKSSILELDEKLQSLAQTDNEIYRSVFGMEEISYDEREAGIGGSDAYKEFDIHSEPAAELLKWTSEKIDNLERRLGMQKLSFEELKEAYNTNREALRHLPAIKPTKGIILSGYGMREHPILMYKRKHNGTDFRAEMGSPVYATADGTVIYAGTMGNLGRIVKIDHGFGYQTLYAHLSTFEKDIKVGSKVERGEKIALSGNTGLTEGPHLHYEIFYNGVTIDPINYLFADISPEEFKMYQEIAQKNTKSMD